MGYTEGKGLGKHEQGRVNIIEASKQRGRRGLGLQLRGLDADESAEWDPNNDKVSMFCYSCVHDKGGLE